MPVLLFYFRQTNGVSTMWPFTTSPETGATCERREDFQKFGGLRGDLTHLLCRRGNAR